MTKYGPAALFILLLLSTQLFARGIRIVPGEPLRSEASSFEVRGRQGILIRQKLRFGPYATTSIRRSAIRKWTGVTGVPGIFATEHMQGRQSIRFALSDGADTMHAELLSKVRSTDLILGDRRNSLPNIMIDVLMTGTAGQQNNFSGFFGTADDRFAWELFLDNTRAQLRRAEPAGFLRSDSAYYTIVPVWEVERKGRVAELLFGAAGLEFRDEQGNTRAAVSLIDGGEIFLGPLPEAERLVLAAACSALLLQSNID